MSTFTRRSFIGKTAVAIGSFAALHKVVSARPTDPDPANRVLDGQNPDSMWPPDTDSKSLAQNFNYPFSFANKRVYEGGWSREVTVRELPVSKSMAGINMRLTAGASGSCTGTRPPSGPSSFTGRRGSRRLKVDSAIKRNRLEPHRPFFILTAGGCSTCPPKPLRMAERIFSAKVCSWRERKRV